MTTPLTMHIDTGHAFDGTHDLAVKGIASDEASATLACLDLTHGKTDQESDAVGDQGDTLGSSKASMGEIIPTIDGDADNPFAEVIANNKAKCKHNKLLSRLKTHQSLEATPHNITRVIATIETTATPNGDTNKLNLNSSMVDKEDMEVDQIFKLMATMDKNDKMSQQPEVKNDYAQRTWKADINTNDQTVAV